MDLTLIDEEPMFTEQQLLDAIIADDLKRLERQNIIFHELELNQLYLEGLQ